jgi:hypothetical protein
MTAMTCFICGSSSGPLEGHHVARSRNSDLTVPLCHGCHVRQNDLQYRVGIMRRLPGDGQRGWQIFGGVGLLMLAQAQAAEDNQLIQNAEWNLHRLLTVLTVVSEEPLGPDSHNNWARPGQPDPKITPEQICGSLRQLFPLLNQLHEELTCLTITPSTI